MNRDQKSPAGRSAGRRSATSARPGTFDGYLAHLDAEKRSALEEIRRVVRSAAPEAEECISYGLPGYRLSGRFLLALGAGVRHCALYLGSTVRRHRTELRGYDTTGRGTIRFSPDRPLPATLVRKLVRARIAERKTSAAGRARSRGSGPRAIRSHPAARR
jgi:uncharacterized protein YdhG (YjbR/CyaY superfamily)